MKKLLFTVAIGLGLLTQSCQKETITTNPNLAKVGDKYLDGYVVSTYSDGHGVIAKKVSGSTNWYSCGTLASGEWRVPSSSELYYMLDNMTLRSKMNISYGYYWSADENYRQTPRLFISNKVVNQEHKLMINPKPTIMVYISLKTIN